MPEASTLIVLALLFTFGLVLGLAGFRRRSLPLLLFGLILCAMPLGFASVILASATEVETPHFAAS